jgi:hypothetical protein
MDIEYARILLGILIENSARILRAGFGVDRAEAALFAVLELLQEEPQLRRDFLEQVSATLDRQDPWGLEVDSVPRELIELAVHELRWSEFLKIADAKLQGTGRDVSAAAERMAVAIRSAYAENWPDREFYRRYQDHE